MAESLPAQENNTQKTGTYLHAPRKIRTTDPAQLAHFKVQPKWLRLWSNFGS